MRSAQEYIANIPDWNHSEIEKALNMSRELYAGHLPYETTENDLRKLFAVAGIVTSVHIITDPQTGKSKGCAYVRMATAEAAQEAINCLDGALLEGRLIIVSEAKPQKQQAKPPFGDAKGRPRQMRSTGKDKHRG